LAETDVPADCPAGQALVRVRRVGICGTDWHAIEDRQPFFEYPRILGHELGVEVLDVNDPSGSLAVGDRCAVEPYLACGTCGACRRGKSNCCEKLRVLGVHIDGGMQEQLLLPAANLHPSRTLSFDQLALVETLGIGCHAADRAKVIADEWVLVVGAGPIGLACAIFAHVAAAGVTVADISAQRLRQCARVLPGVHTMLMDETFAGALANHTGGEMPQVIIDATGNPDSMARSFDLIAYGGRIVFAGLCKGDIRIDDANFHRREVSLLASRNARRDDFTRIIAMLETGEIEVGNWITHRASPETLIDSIPTWRQRGGDLLKAVVEF
jgi:2-desacetyl-2-hydroxyethyl bacteriochlorophyllide A dehydrogenase